MNNKISDNLRQLRKLRGLTQSDLAAQLTIASGETVLPVTISRWENGRRAIPAYMLGYAAQILHTSAQAFYDLHTTPDDKRLLLEYAAMKDREKGILRYIVANWQGDAHALIHWIALYISVAKRRRADLVGPAIHSYHAMRAAGDIDSSAPAPDIEYLEKACDALILANKKRGNAKK